MALYPTYTAADIASFTGRVLESFPEPYTDNSALPQALLLFRLASGLADWPDAADDAQLAKYAVLSLADAFVLSQPAQKQAYNPFQSETIGSYSYTLALKKLQAGQPLGIMWFDLAIQRLGVSDDVASVTSGSLELFERDALICNGKILGPADIFPLDQSWGGSVSVGYEHDPNTGRVIR